MNTYLLFKSLHLIAVISWMAGLLYLPRIFVYHSENMNREEICTVFKTMEIKLYSYIMTPAMILTWLFGLILISKVGFETISTKWLQIKLILVTLLSVYHFYLGSLLLKFNKDINTKSSKFFQMAK
jgi:putative membrane protein